MMAQFTHLNKNAQPVMVDVGEKEITHRTATAQCVVTMPEEVIVHLQQDNFTTKKGSIFQTAMLAGIMASKKTGDLIPLCHPLGLENCEVTIELNEQQEVIIRCTASITAKTGVEMEALTGASVAALTIYDMCKALSHDIIIKELKLMEKTGGRHDFKRE
ncbi:MAG: cyclic pyranopterin monophosphate synthase MoaC [Chitinophagaceae bacterium]